MIESHINAIEEVLIAQSKAAKNAGHPNLRGGPREWFIRDFLSAHLPSTLEIGQGEIIDVNSIPNPLPNNYRPQVDIVLYRRDLPKISYSKTDFAYLAEGVMATIESKSVITDDELKKANKAAIEHNALTRNNDAIITFGRHHNLYQYVIAFDGPAKMSTVANWLTSQIETNHWNPSQMVDMIIVLGKGVLWKLSAFLELEIKSATTANNWVYIDQLDKNLLTLFIHMIIWATSLSTPPNTLGYVSKVQLKNFNLI